MNELIDVFFKRVLDFSVYISSPNDMLTILLAVFLAYPANKGIEDGIKAIDPIREKYFHNQISRRSLFNLLFWFFFALSWFICPYQEDTARHFLCTLTFTFLIFFISSLVIYVLASLYMLIYDIMVFCFTIGLKHVDKQ